MLAVTTVGQVIGAFFVIDLVVVLIVMIAWAKIISKAGYNGWLVLLALIPLVNVILFFVFAFSTWPIEQRLRSGGYGGYPPGSYPGAGYPAAGYPGGYAANPYGAPAPVTAYPPAGYGVPAPTYAAPYQAQPQPQQQAPYQQQPQPQQQPPPPAGTASPAPPSLPPLIWQEPDPEPPANPGAPGGGGMV